MAITATVPLVKQLHPIYVKMISAWKKWRSLYEGGEDLINNQLYLRRFSKRETTREFSDRRELTYNPAHVKRIVNSVRNSITSKLNEVVRDGDPRYLEMIKTDVNLQNESMNAFLGLRVIPYLLVHGRRLVCIDSPPLSPGSTMADDQGKPYMWAVSAEDTLSWHVNQDSGILDSVLIQELVEVQDPVTGLVTSSTPQLRYMRYLYAGQSLQGLEGPGAMVKIMDQGGKDKQAPMILTGLTRLPIVDVQIPQSLIEDLARYQIALLNLASSDMNFLFRGNFPVFTKQYDPIRNMIRPRGSKAILPEQPTLIASPDRDVDEDEQNIGLKAGAAQGVGYAKELERPGFIGPPTDNLRASMEKQKALVEEMNILCDMALTSISIKALEQSGKSKELDRIGRDEGLVYIGNVLESAERQVATIIHEFLQSNDQIVVKYPNSYAYKTPSDAFQEVEQLKSLKALVRVPAYQKAVDKQISEIVLRQFSDNETMQQSQSEIAAMEWFDENADRAKVIEADVASGLVSKGTASTLRGYPEGEAGEATAEQVKTANTLSGGEIGVPPQATEPKAPKE